MPTLLSVALLSSSSITDPKDVSFQDLGTTVDQVNNLAKSINEYGPLIVALALVMVLLIIVMGYMLYRTNATIEQLQTAAKADEENKNEQINKLLEHLLNSSNIQDQFAEKVSEKITANAPAEEEEADDEHKDIVGMYIDVNMAFKSASRIALSKLHCSRIGIYVFHNGNQSLHGLPFFKMSCVHEWTIRGSKTMRGKTHYEMPLHMYGDIIERLATDGEYAVSDVQMEVVQIESLMDFVMPSDVKSIYMMAIKDLDGVLAGFSIAEYNKAVDFSDLEFFELNSSTMTDLNESIRDIVLQDGFMDGFKH